MSSINPLSVAVYRHLTSIVATPPEGFITTLACGHGIHTGATFIRAEPLGVTTFCPVCTSIASEILSKSPDFPKVA
jgi:hypothetical protein